MKWNLKSIIVFFAIIIIGSILCIIIYNNNNPKKIKYKEALQFLENNSYDAAIVVFKNLGNYKDSEIKIKEAKYLKAKEKYKEGYITSSYLIFSEIEDYKDVTNILNDDIFNIFGTWSWSQYNNNKYVYISLDFSKEEDKMKQNLYVGSSDVQNNNYFEYKILNKDIYIKTTDEWTKIWHIDSITKSTLTVKSISSNNQELYNLSKSS